MWYPVMLPCRNIVEVQERQDWARARDMNILNRTWEVINGRQYVKFNFQFEKDAIFFALHWL